MRPGCSGSSRWPPITAAQKSVPPEMLFHQMPGVPGAGRAANCAVPQRWTSSASGEPVLPMARTRDRSPQSASERPAFMQLA
jgi:hypothetical protein